MYIKVVRDIKEYYANFVDEKELEVLNKILFIIKDKNDNEISDEIIIFINRILDRIWNLTLTDIKDFENGEDFCFLIKKINLDYEIDTNYDDMPKSSRYEVLGRENKVVKDKDGKEVIKEYNFIDANQDEFELLTEKDIVDIDLFDRGKIISINYTNNLRTTPVLPIYFKDGSKKIENLIYDTVAYYAVDIDSVYEMSGEDRIAELSRNNNKEYILIDKALYRENLNTTVLSNKDINNLIVSYILKYIDNNSIDNLDITSLSFKDRVLKFDKNKIKREIIKYYNGEINLEILEKNIDDIVENRYKILTEKTK